MLGRNKHISPPVSMLVLVGLGSGSGLGSWSGLGSIRLGDLDLRLGLGFWLGF